MFKALASVTVILQGPQALTQKFRVDINFLKLLAAGGSEGSPWESTLVFQKCRRKQLWRLLYKVHSTDSTEGKIALLEPLVVHFLKFGNLSLIKGMVILSTVKVEENAQYKVYEVTTTQSRRGQVASSTLGQMSNKADSQKGHQKLLFTPSLA